jgi:fermentation-respiration switch protein FrsA (DUF1100 family)
MLVLAIAAAIASVPLLTAIERAFLFHPRREPFDTRLARVAPGLERVWIDTDEGRVEAFFVPGAGASAAHAAPLVVYAHGNAELIDDLPEWLAPYRAMGVSLLLPEYRGYGRSDGSPSQRAIASDAVAFRDLAAGRPEVDASRIVYHGVSLGGGVVSQLARERPPAALILQSTFTSVADIAWDRFRAPRFLLADPFDSLYALRDCRARALVFHGRRDDLIPFAHGERLHRALDGSRFVACEAGHNDLPPPDLDYWTEIESFLRSADILR